MWRVLRIVIFSSLLLLLSLYGYRHDPAVTLKMCQTEPQRFSGRIVEIGRETILIKSWPDSFRIRQLGVEATIIGSAGAAQPGDFVQMLVRFDAPDQFTLQELYIAAGRRAKIVWSQLPLMLLALFWIRQYRFNPGKFSWEERR
jgi:hypothetical protein